MSSRKKVVELLQKWVGKKESDGSFKTIIDIYNSYEGKLPRNTRMQYDWAWCACTWSAAAVKLDYTDVMPIEISCPELIKKAKKMGIWNEKDTYIPKPGDAVLYDWDDNGLGDNKGNPDHIGTVEYVNKKSGYMQIIEGNYMNAVKRRILSINGRFIRGYITPKYSDDSTKEYDLKENIKNKKNKKASIVSVAKEVIIGKWGDGEERKKNLKEAGYNYEEIQKKVTNILNKPRPIKAAVSKDGKTVTATCKAKKYSDALDGKYKTTANLYLRNDAGTNKKALTLIPEGTTVQCYGYYNTTSDATWLYIETTINGIKYVGFSCSRYLKMI